MNDSDDTHNQIVKVCACRPMNQSGIIVEEGQKYRFQIVEWREQWVDGCVDATPERGWTSSLYNLGGELFGPMKRSNKVNWYALVGAICGSDQNEKDCKDNHESFAVFPQDESPVVMHKAGRLYFYANDKEGRYFNNMGSIKLKVIND
ncbi:MAG: hypothetical protein AB7L09_04990 [Nitrospira sp.]